MIAPRHLRALRRVLDSDIVLCEALASDSFTLPPSGSAHRSRAGDTMQKPGVNRNRASRWRNGVALVLSVIVGTSCGGSGSTAGSSPETAPQPAETGVAGLGRIEAGNGVVRVAARSSFGTPIVERLLVQKGDTVKAGQVLAELDNKDELQLAVQQAASRTEVARRRLDQVRTGAKASEVSATDTDIEALEIDLANARTELQRYTSLGTNVSATDLDRMKLRVESATRALAAARLRRTGLTEVRPVDVEVAQAELDEAIKAEARARLDAETSTVEAPIDGRVVEIHAWRGEMVGPEGLLELAPAEPMYAVAEVAESDIARVRVGQRATVTADALKAPLQGVVERISTKVLQNQIMPVDPANFSDSRVVEVWIRLDDGGAAADLIHLRVDVVIKA
jgi:HlyD family secretion protein